MGNVIVIEQLIKVEIPRLSNASILLNLTSINERESRTLRKSLRLKGR